MSQQAFARDLHTNAWLRVSLSDAAILACDPCDPPPTPAWDDHWLAPAFCDIQTNGRMGVSFSDPTLTVERVREIVRANAERGVGKLCPTLISAPERDFLRCLETIARACRTDPEVDRMVLGIHLEGPYLSSLEGYRGAHPEHVLRDPDWRELERFQEASGGRVILMTLAPERDGAIEFIKRAIAHNITIALGHTAASCDQITAAVDAGARLSTHLGNGIADQLKRHPNPIWRQAGDDRLMASLIADGLHLDADTLKVLVRAKGLERVILVSDASPLAGLSPGRFGDWEVTPEGKIVVAGTPYLAGSNCDLIDGLGVFLSATGLSLREAITTVTDNPLRLLEASLPPAHRSPSPARLLLRTSRQGVELIAKCRSSAETSPIA